MERMHGLIGVLTFLLLFLSPQVSYCLPKASIPGVVYDAGEIPQGKEISHEFSLKNTGDEPLTFKVRPC